MSGIVNPSPAAQQVRQQVTCPTAPACASACFAATECLHGLSALLMCWGSQLFTRCFETGVADGQQALLHARQPRKRVICCTLLLHSCWLGSGVHFASACASYLPAKANLMSQKPTSQDDAHIEHKVLGKFLCCGVLKCTPYKT